MASSSPGDRNYSSDSSKYTELLPRQILNTPPLYKPDCGVLPIHQPSVLTMNCSGALIPKYIVRYNPVRLKGKQTTIHFRISETVCLLQTDCTNHNSPFVSPANHDLSGYLITGTDSVLYSRFPSINILTPSAVWFICSSRLIAGTPSCF